MTTARNPYAAPATSNPSRSPTGAPRLAERGARVGAAIVDGLVVGAAFLVAFVSITAVDPMVGVAVMAIGVGAIIIVNLVMLARSGQTIGKRMVGIKIVRTDGEPAGVARTVLLRIVVSGLLSTAVAFAISGPEIFAAERAPGAPPSQGEIIGMLIGFTGLLLIFTPARRCLHDYIAGTIVVKA